MYLTVLPCLAYGLAVRSCRAWRAGALCPHSGARTLNCILHCTSDIIGAPIADADVDKALALALLAVSSCIVSLHVTGQMFEFPRAAKFDASCTSRSSSLSSGNFISPFHTLIRMWIPCIAVQPRACGLRSQTSSAWAPLAALPNIRPTRMALVPLRIVFLCRLLKRTKNW
jgi:hypothetical protein